jgi:hypothetical protein
MTLENASGYLTRCSASSSRLVSAVGPTISRVLCRPRAMSAKDQAIQSCGDQGRPSTLSFPTCPAVLQPSTKDQQSRDGTKSDGKKGKRLHTWRVEIRIAVTGRVETSHRTGRAFRAFAPFCLSGDWRRIVNPPTRDGSPARKAK